MDIYWLFNAVIVNIVIVSNCCLPPLRYPPQNHCLHHHHHRLHRHHHHHHTTTTTSTSTIIKYLETDCLLCAILIEFCLILTSSLKYLFLYFSCLMYILNLRCKAIQVCNVFQPHDNKIKRSGIQSSSICLIRVCECVCVHACMCVRVCVSVKETYRDRKRDRETNKEKETLEPGRDTIPAPPSVCQTHRQHACPRFARRE